MSSVFWPVFALLSLANSLPCCALRAFHLDLIVFVSLPNSSLISERAFSLTSLLE